MSPLLILLFLSLSHLLVLCHTDDEEELLKCRIDTLMRDYKELKEKTRKMTIKQLVDIKQLRMEKDEEMKEMKLENEEAMKKLKEDGDKEIKQVKLGSKEALEKVRDDAEEKIRQLKQEHVKEIKQLRSEGDGAIQQLRKEKDNDIDKLKLSQKKDVQLLQVEIDNTKRHSLLQNYTLTDINRKVSKISTVCHLLPTNICGTCICLDHYSIQQRYSCDCQHLAAKRDCRAFHEAGHEINGVYVIHNNHLKVMQVFCDMKTDGGGWVVFQRRIDGTMNFYRDWNMYRNGFGNPNDEFWTGNERLHIVTSQSTNGSQLRIDMRDWDEKLIYAQYENFSVDDEKRKYKLHAAGFSGNHGDSLSYHNGRRFSTYDQDNDDYPASCSQDYRAGWWYRNCHVSNLNGEYRWFDEKQPGEARGIIWNTYKGNGYPMKTVEMKVRRKG